VNVLGELHAANAPVSTRHWTVPSETVKPNVAALVLLGLFGVLVIVTVGAAVSIVHVKLALPTLPAVSVDWTVKVWLPSARPVNDVGDAHVANAPLSSLHVSAPSEAVNVNVAFAELLGLLGLPVIVTSALADPARQAQALELGASEYLVKTKFSLADLTDAIRRHLAA